MARLRRAEVIVGLVSGFISVLLVLQLSSAIASTATKSGDAFMSKSNQPFAEQSRRRRTVDGPLGNPGHLETNSPSTLNKSDITDPTNEEGRSGMDLEQIAEKLAENLKGGLESLKCSLGFCSNSTSAISPNAQRHMNKTNQPETSTMSSVEHLTESNHNETTELPGNHTVS